MDMETKKIEKPAKVLFLALIYGWLSLLMQQEGRAEYNGVYLSVYGLCALLAVVCALRLEGASISGWDRKTKIVTLGLSFLLSQGVVLANYSLLEPWGTLQSLASAGMLLAGGVCVAWPIIGWLATFLPRPVIRVSGEKGKWVFAISFLLIVLVDFGYLFGVSYPGVLTRDSLSTIQQNLGQLAYNKVMPYWHTKLAGVFLRLGMGLTGDINGAVATFHVAQILFMAACFSYGVMTVYQLGVPRWNLLLLFGFYCLMPYHIVFSSTLWKDVPFAGSLLLMLVALFRVLRGMGKRPWVDWLLLILGAAGFSLLRTNGWYALLATVAILWVIRGGGTPVLAERMTLVLLVTWVMLNPLLDAMGVKGMDMTEAFAVPMQQIGRVVSQGRELTQQENQVLGELFDLEKLEEVYTPNTVDPVKFQTFHYDVKETVRQNPWRYLRVYLSVGARYPGDYLKAWVEETKGFWNAGYHYQVYDISCEGTQLGIQRREANHLLEKLYGQLFRICEKAVFLEFTVSIGLFVWALLILFAVAWLKGWEEKILFIPVLVIVVGLWLGTPVFAEFRYAYPMILTAPFFLEVCIYHPETRQ